LAVLEMDGTSLKLRSFAEKSLSRSSLAETGTVEGETAIQERIAATAMSFESRIAGITPPMRVRRGSAAARVTAEVPNG
jgi:hypothetical protein